ncbi:MAG: hypothetical protein HY329_24660 [Chloroflexi bacterium]|nr:hypothetical protein [Chloroflexota bacterium]
MIVGVPERYRGPVTLRDQDNQVLGSAEVEVHRERWLPSASGGELAVPWLHWSATLWRIQLIAGRPTAAFFRGDEPFIIELPSSARGLSTLIPGQIKGTTWAARFTPEAPQLTPLAAPSWP